MHSPISVETFSIFSRVRQSRFISCALRLTSPNILGPNLPSLFANNQPSTSNQMQTTTDTSYPDTHVHPKSRYHNGKRARNLYVVTFTTTILYPVHDPFQLQPRQVTLVSSFPTSSPLRVRQRHHFICQLPQRRPNRVMAE